MTGTPPNLQFKTCTFPSRDLVQAACREIAQDFTRGAPGAASPTIVVPDLHAVPAVARALHAAFAVPVLVLPRIVTLRAWAEDVAIDEEFEAPAQREAHLYRALAERNWLAGADLWAVAAELARVFDELSRWNVRLPASVNGFKAQLDAAYRARAGASFGFEARLIHELWHASHAPGILDAETAYGLQLMRLAQHMASPIHALGLTRLAPVEEDFLRRCAERVVVTRYAVDRDAPASGLEHFLAQAWPQDSRCDLCERARVLRVSVASSPLKGRLNFFAATSAEEEALAVDAAVRRWLGEGRARIGVVIFDRVVARRARALLERADVLVRDEAGWPLSTTSAATVIGRWLDAVSNDFYYRDCLDLLKSPFVLHDQPRDERQQAVWRLELALRATNVHSGIAQYLRLAAQAGDRALSELLKRLARAEQLFARNRRKTLRAWIDALQRSLTEIGVYAGLAADAAGIELLELLDALRADLDTDQLRLEFGEWRRWLAHKLEGAAFRDRSIDSPIVFTTLAATRLRAFDAAIILGADVNHLPGSEPAGSLFNQSVRRELGLPVRADDNRRTEEELSALLASCDDVLVTWQHTREGEENLLSPLLERLTVLHGLAWKEDLQDDSLRATIASAAINTHRSELPPATARPQPRITAGLLPETISASAYNSLLACPYQFHARYVLGLAKIDEVQEEVDKADYGTQVHDVLSEFHRTHPLVSDLEPNVAQQRLGDMSRQGFQKLIAHDYQASAWLARWLALVPQYLDWQREREGAGWRFSAAEADRTFTITTPGGHSLVLRGRIDRVDTRGDGAIAVVDYKTRPVGPLRRSLSTPGEDVQLPAYALLWGGEVAAAFFLSLDRDGVAQVDLKADVDALARATRIRLAQIYDEIAAGAPLPAQGAEEVCGYCDVRGLCRKNFWP